MVWVIVVIIVVAVLLLLVFFQFNKLRKLDVNASEGYSQIEVQLHRRTDLIPNLVETVKGYAAHERGVFDEVTKARSQATEAHTVSQTAAADASVTRALSNIMAVAENYPDLKASANFLQLQEELTTTENKIAFARQYYNESVRALNTATVTVPSMWFKGVAGVSKREFYEVPEGVSRNAPNVGFS